MNAQGAQWDCRCIPVNVQGDHGILLSPALAIHIFNQCKTRTNYTAALLSAEFGISVKAIRNIWTRRSWVQETRPHWPAILTNEQLEFSDSPGQP